MTGGEANAGRGRGASAAPGGVADGEALVALAREGLAAARRAGALEAEAFVWSERVHGAFLSGRVSMSNATDVSGVCIRARTAKGAAHATTAGLRPEDVAYAADRAAWAASRVPDVASPGFAQPTASGRAPSEIHRGLVHPEPDRMLAAVEALKRRAERTAEADYFMATTTTHAGAFAVANTNGVEAWDRTAHETATIEVRCRGGDGHKVARLDLHDRAPLALGRLDDLGGEAAELARSSLRPRPLPGPVNETILDASCANLVFFSLLPSLSARAAAGGRSRFAGGVGQATASELFTLRDEPWAGQGCRWQRTDDEGTPTTPRPLIERGVLRNTLVDWAGSRETGQAPTGNGLRNLTARYSSLPKPRAVNAVVSPGDRTLEEMVGEAKRAVLVRGGLVGGFTANALTGDVSCIAPTAFYVENGRIQHALPSVALGGNVFDAVKEIVALGRDPFPSPRGASVALWTRGFTCTT